MKLTATELRQNLYKILDHALETGETVEIRRNRGVAALVPISEFDASQTVQIGLLKSKGYKIKDDFAMTEEEFIGR